MKNYVDNVITGVFFRKHVDCTKTKCECSYVTQFWQLEIGKIEDEILLAINKFEQCRLYVEFFTRDQKMCCSTTTISHQKSICVSRNVNYTLKQLELMWFDTY